MDELKEKFKRLCKVCFAKNLTMFEIDPIPRGVIVNIADYPNHRNARYHEYLKTFSLQQLKEFWTEAIDEMQKEHALEIDTDPMGLDGQFLELYIAESDLILDERTIHDAESYFSKFHDPHGAINFNHGLKIYA